jgi:two-component system KDP operon response regulator KdpE
LIKPSAQILVVDDERPIRRFLHTSLSPSYAVSEAETGSEALQSVALHHPDLVLLDLGLPEMDGKEVIRQLREWTLVPIIVLSVRDREQDKITVLDLGADDYLTKPFGAGELLARIRTALRHTAKNEAVAVYRSGDLVVNLGLRHVLIDDQPVQLTPTEYDILCSLVLHAGKVLTHKQLTQAVWGSEAEADAHLLQVNVSNLRRKVEKDPSRPQHIITETGVGYRLKEIEENQ